MKKFFLLMFVTSFFLTTYTIKLTPKERRELEKKIRIDAADKQEDGIRLAKIGGTTFALGALSAIGAANTQNTLHPTLLYVGAGLMMSGLGALVWGTFKWANGVRKERSLPEETSTQYDWETDAQEKKRASA